MRRSMRMYVKGIRARNRMRVFMSAMREARKRKAHLHLLCIGKRIAGGDVDAEGQTVPCVRCVRKEVKSRAQGERVNSRACV